MNFGSDNLAGAAPRILDAITKAYQGPMPAYGKDDLAKQAERALCETFETELTAFFVVSGTAANTLALSTLASPWEGIYCHPHAHIHSSESTGPALMTGGASLLPVPGNTIRLTPANFDAFLTSLPASKDPHEVRPSALSLSQTNELGQVYTLDELTALCRMAKSHGLKVHMDGARFANAVSALGCSPADMSWRAGVDVLCLGATKCGAIAAEAVIFFDQDLARDFVYRIKRSGHLVSKGRLFGAQFLAWLEDGYWLQLAVHANQMAERLRTELVRLNGVRLAFPTQGNETFAILPTVLAQKLWDAGASFYPWPGVGLPAEMVIEPHESLVRFVTSFATRDDEIEQLMAHAH